MTLLQPEVKDCEQIWLKSFKIACGKNILLQT